MNTNNFDFLSENKPANCELRPDYMYYSRQVHSSWEALLFVLLSIGCTGMVAMLFIALLSDSFEETKFILIPLSIFFVLDLIFLWFTFVFLFEKEIGWLDKKGFHQEFRCVRLVLREKNISLCSIRNFKATSSNSKWIILIDKIFFPFIAIFCILSPPFWKFFASRSAYFDSEEKEYVFTEIYTTTGKTISIFNIADSKSNVPYWIARASNLVLNNLTCSQVLPDYEQDSVSSNEFLEVGVFNHENVNNSDTVGEDLPDFQNSLEPLSTQENFLLENVPELDKPGYSIWNMEQDFQHIIFGRQNQYSSSWLLSLKLWFYMFGFLCIVTLLLVYVGCPEKFDINTINAQDVVIMFFISVILPSSYSFLLLPCQIFFLYLFTRFTTVTWTFSTQKATLKRTLFGIPFLFRTFDIIDVTHFRIQQRFLLGSTDYFYDLIFLNKDDKEAFRIKKVERDDAKWILSCIKDYFRK